MKKYLYVAATVVALFMMSMVNAQTIKLLDIYNGEPISNVHFTINGISGISGEDGEISYKANETAILTLSHIQYGSIVLSPEERLAAEKAGSFKMIMVSLNLQPVTVLDKSQNEEVEIPLRTEDKLTHDAGAFLHQLPEINVVKKSGSYGFDPVLRGMKYDRLNIVIDGVQTAHAACPNRMDPPISQIPMNTIESVEILKGPYSLRFGNSFGGTINFLSKGSSFNAKKPVYGRASTSYEGNGNVFRSEALVGISKEKLNLELHGAYSNGTNYTDGNGNEIASAFNRLNFGGQLGYKINANHQVSLKGTANMAKDVDFPSLPMDLRSDNTFLFQLKHQYEKNSGYLRSWNTSVYNTSVDHVMDNLDKVYALRMVDAVTEATTSSYGGRTEAKLLFKNSILYLGGDLKSERADGTRRKEFVFGANDGIVKYDNIWQGAQVVNAGLFGEYQLRYKKYMWMVTGRFDYNDAKANDPDPNFPTDYETMNSTNFNFSASTGIKRDLTNSSTLGLWFGGVSRNGGITEKFINYIPVGADPYEMIGNQQLKPENNYQADLRYDLNTKKSAFSVNVFASYIQDYISATIREDLKPKTPTSPGVRQYNNVGDANFLGGEVTFTQQIPYNLRFRISAAYTWAENITINEPIAEIAPLDTRFVLLGSYFDNKLQPQIAVRYVANQFRISESFGEKNTPEFALMDFAVTYNAWEKWTFSGGVKNMFDAAYYEHLSRMMTGSSGIPIYNVGRSFYATASFRF
jgi:iron complex outermembrane receptor protein